jgi:serine/threonine protein kinase
MSMKQAAGPTLLGRYQLLGELGRGAMSTVYEALDPSLDRKVAIKTLEKRRVDDPDFIRRFLLEAKFVASLSHPNVVPIHDMGEDDDYAYIVMQMVPGGSLRQRLNEGGPQPIERALRWMSQLLAALDHVHRAGIVHRDIKPGNVMLDEADNVKLADFGVARALDRAEHTAIGTVIGTPKYMAPEQLGGGAISAATDLFAAALIAYRLFTGRDAFDGSSVAVMMRSVMFDDPTPPSRVPGSQLPDSLDAVFARALAKEPAQRFGDALALDAALHGALSHFERAIADADGTMISRLPPGALARRSPDTGSLDPIPDPFADPFSAFVQPSTGGAIAPSADADHAPDWKPSIEDLLGSSPAAADGTVLFAPPRRPPTGPPGEADRPGGSTAPLRPEVQLVAVVSPDSHLVGRVTPINGDVFVIGRDPGCDLVVNDRACTRQHVRIRYADGRYSVTDLGSTNGTWLDGRSVPGQRSMPLMFGSTIRIGDSSFTFAHRRDTTLPDLSGQWVAGRYQVLEVMRASPKATVYKARVGEVGPMVALKLLSPELAAYPGYRERLRQAAEVASRLQHPHICQLLDHGVAEVDVAGSRVSTPYLCHTLLAGGSLAPHLLPQARVPLERVTRWLRQVSAALGHAHRRGIVHGDLKPTSIAFDEEDNAYLMDFAFATGQPTLGEQPVFGAPAFMAPELWQGAAPDERSDQFALAVIAYALVTGVRPFIGQEDPQQRERNFRRGAPPAHEEARAGGRDDLPGSVSPVLQRALAVDPLARHESVEAFWGLLERTLRGGRSGADVPRVFVSYQHDPSAGWAVLLARELKDRHRISGFVDTQRLDAAIQFPAKLAQAIDECDVFVCLLAAGTLDSRWVREEIRVAHRRGKPMVPVFQESFTAPADDTVDDALRALLQFDGVHLLDRRNIHIDHTIDDLARLVLGTLRRAQE